MESIIRYFSKIGISEKDLDPFLSQLQHKAFTPGEHMVVSGQTDQYLSFLKSGIIRYYVLAESKDVTFDFIFPETFYCHYDSFYMQKPSAFYSEALTDIEIYRIHSEKLKEIFKNCSFAKELSRIAVEKLLERKIERELLLLTKAPKERYLSLLSEQPKLLQHIPQKYLATYLGVAPETLSRIKKRLRLIY